jgi:hypothetical protein
LGGSSHCHSARKVAAAIAERPVPALQRIRAQDQAATGLGFQRTICTRSRWLACRIASGSRDLSIGHRGQDLFDTAAVSDRRSQIVHEQGSKIQIALPCLASNSLPSHRSRSFGQAEKGSTFHFGPLERFGTPHRMKYCTSTTSTSNNWSQGVSYIRFILQYLSPLQIRDKCLPMRDSPFLQDSLNPCQTVPFRRLNCSTCRDPCATGQFKLQLASEGSGVGSLIGEMLKT